MGVVDFFVGCFWWVVCCFVFFGYGGSAVSDKVS